MVRCLRLRRGLGLRLLVTLLLLLRSCRHRGRSTSRGITAARIFRLSEWMRCRNCRTRSCRCWGSIRSRRAGSWPASSAGGCSRSKTVLRPLRTATPVLHGHFKYSLKFFLFLSSDFIVDCRWCRIFWLFKFVVYIGSSVRCS
jgi:hypothetical protein